MVKSAVNWDEISFFVRSKNRKIILENLLTPKTPTQIKKEVNLHFNSVSRTIIELEKEGFIKCLNPDQKLARFYQIAEKGRKMLKSLKQCN